MKATHTPDHPHVRGEKRHMVINRTRNLGSSPRAWGKEPCMPCCRFMMRIIPTCVGKSSCVARHVLSRSDHPHVRGEKRSIFFIQTLLFGSSPRAWGKVAFRQQQFASHRIIPTCVGKSFTIHNCCRDFPDHPHVRGEKNLTGSPGKYEHGSSPRAWGKGVT